MKIRIEYPIATRQRNFSTMSEGDIKPSKLCRVCLNSSVKMYMSIFEKYREFAVNDYILLITNVDIKKEVGLPDKICVNCFMELETALAFKQKCENTDSFLKTSRDKIIEACATADVNDIIIVKKEEPYETEIKFEEVTDADSIEDDYYGVEALEEILVDDVKPLKNKPSVDSSVQCHDCGGMFKSKCKLRVHWKKVHMLANLVCEICKRQFKSYRAFHVHKKKGTKSCKTAGSSFVRIEGKGRSRIFYCKECEYKTKRTKDIEVHILVHSGDRPYQCKICENRYTQQSSLQSHMEGAHKQYIKEVTCHFCGKQLKGRTNVYRHMLTHTEPRHPCPVCQKPFPKRHLKQHMLRHSGTKSYTCEKCASTFYTLAELCNHRRWVHNKKKDAYKCDMCGYASNRSERVKIHRKRHTDSNVPCLTCGMFFPTEQKMEAHRKQHYEEKIHECPYCDMKFYRKHSVGKHISKKHKRAVQIAKERASPISCKVENPDNNDLEDKAAKNNKQEEA